MGSLFSSILEQADHLSDPDRPLIGSTLRRVDPAEPRGPVKLRKRIEVCSRIRSGVERGGDVRREVRSLRTLRLQQHLDIGSIRGRNATPGRTEHDDRLPLALLDDATHRTAANRARDVMTTLRAPHRVRVERNSNPRPPLPIHGN